MNRWTHRALVVGTIVLPIPAGAQTQAPPDAVVYIITPRDGQRVRSPITVRFGLRNMGVTRAGDATPNMGHHHLLVDVAEPVAENEPLPTDRKHLHFGAGQTETQLDLPPGKHTLQLVLGDAEHKPFKPIVASNKISITVVKSRPPQTSAR
jgi:hypothetical protein